MGPAHPLPAPTELLARWAGAGGTGVVFLSPADPPAALYRAAGVLALPPRCRPPGAAPLPPPLEEVLPALGRGNLPGARDPLPEFLDAVEEIVARLGRPPRAPVGEGALARALDGERRVAARLASLGAPPGWVAAAELLPPAAFLLLAGGTAPGVPPTSPPPAPHLPFLDGRSWPGRGDPRLFAARSWRERLRVLAVPAGRFS